jgi:hypothetical protein
MDHLQPFGADAFYRDYRVKGKLAARGRKAARLYEQVNDIRGKAYCIGCLGEVADMQSKYDEARAHFEEALPLFEKVSNRQDQAHEAVSNCLQQLGFVALEADPCFFRRLQDDQITLVILYVDDIAVAGSAANT